MGVWIVGLPRLRRTYAGIREAMVGIRETGRTGRAGVSEDFTPKKLIMYCRGVRGGGGGGCEGGRGDV